MKVIYPEAAFLLMAGAAPAQEALPGGASARLNPWIIGAGLGLRL